MSSRQSPFLSITEHIRLAGRGNIYDRTELAGAFGDLGTFIPFVVAYITINKMDPVGILVSFGIFKIWVGLVFRTPIAVQPMKAIGGAAIANPQAISHGMIWASGLFTAIFWTTMALTGAIEWLGRITTKPIMRGIMLGLGISFALDGLGMMGSQPILAAAGIVLALLFISSQRLPAMLLLLALGVGAALVTEPALLEELRLVSIHLRLPSFALSRMTWNDVLQGTLVLGIPQLPLTLGNVILATVGENNQIFADRPLTLRTVALDHGLMNFVSLIIGGVPLCHGAGGMAGHVRFGARTGGALVIMGLIALLIGLFLSDSVSILFRMMPDAILGVILFFAGLELAVTMRDIGSQREDIYVMLLTAALATVNMGVAFFAGVVLFYSIQRHVVTL